MGVQLNTVIRKGRKNATIYRDLVDDGTRSRYHRLSRPWNRAR